MLVKEDARTDLRSGRFELRAASPTPLIARIRSSHDSTRMSIRSIDGSLQLLQLGPGYAASITRRGRDGAVNEASISNAIGTNAVVTEVLRVSKGILERKRSTTFTSGTERVEQLTFIKGVLEREVRWTYPDARSAAARYSEWKRDLRVYVDGEEVGRSSTSGLPGEGTWTSSTKGAGQPWASFRSPFTGVSNSAASAGETNAQVSSNYENGPAPVKVAGRSSDGLTEYHYSSGPTAKNLQGDGTNAVHEHFDAANSKGYVWGEKETTENASKGSFETVTYWEVGTNRGPESDGSAASGMQKVTKDLDTGGTTTETTWNIRSSLGAGSTSETGRSTVTTDGKGNSEGSYSISHADGSKETGNWSTKDGSTTGSREVTGTDGTSSRTGFASDGQGNSSQSSVEYHQDGSFSITTKSEGSDGSKTEDKREYDKDGNEKPPPSDDGSQGGGGNGGGSGNGSELPADDGFGGTGGPTGPNMIGALTGYGECPSGDGGDPEPDGYVGAPAGAALRHWLSGGSPFQGGRSSSGSRFIGDAFDHITDAIGGEGDGDGTGRGQDDAGGVMIDLRAIMRQERDPENNPRALFGCLAQFGGISSSSASLRAAAHVVGEFIE